MAQQLYHQFQASGSGSGLPRSVSGYDQLRNVRFDVTIASGTATVRIEWKVDVEGFAWNGLHAFQPGTVTEFTASGSVSLMMTPGLLVRARVVDSTDATITVTGHPLDLRTSDFNGRRLFVCTFNPKNGKAAWAEWTFSGDETILCMDTQEVPGRGPVLTLIMSRPSGIYMEHISLTEGDTP